MSSFALKDGVVYRPIRLCARGWTPSRPLPQWLDRAPMGAMSRAIGGAARNEYESKMDG